ncbi:MAG: hypothetical protein GX616_19110 [Planctomycetes bacterium]|nr:hypothetical protein [Planctomycetota bacterium]
MSKNRAYKVITMAVLAIMLLTSCSAQQPAPAPAAQPTTAPEQPTAAPAQSTTAPEPTKAPEPTAVPEPVAAKPFVFAHTGPIRTLDAPVTWYGSTHWLTNLLFDCLIWRKSDGSGYVGQAAEKWENVDPTTWRFYLREGLTFHNGEPLDAEAVKWNIERVMSRKDFQVQPQWEFIDKVTVIDPTTVEITTDEPHAYFEYDVSYNGCELLPPAYLQEVGEEKFGTAPVGSGPYKLAKLVLNEKYEFEAWDGYWGGKQPVEKVIYQVIPEKASQMAALLAGQVSLVAGVPIPDLPRVEAAQDIKTMSESSNRLHMLYLRSEIESGNMAKKYPDYKPATLDIRIRQAISHALDRTLLAEVQGTATPTLVRLSRNDPESYAEKYAGTQVADEWYDPDLAKQLIKEAGYDPDNGNKPKLYFDAPAAYFGNEKEVAEAIKAMLEEVGFEVELSILDRSAYFEQIDEPGNNRDMILVTLGGGASLIPTFYTCDWWESTYHVCEKEWSDLGEEMIKTVDPVKRKEMWGTWWEYFIDFAQTVPLYELDNVYAMDASFNWEPRADGWMTFRELTPAK